MCSERESCYRGGMGVEIEGIIEGRTRMIESQLKMYEQQELMSPTVTHSKQLNRTKNT